MLTYSAFVWGVLFLVGALYFMALTSAVNYSLRANRPVRRSSCWVSKGERP